MICVHTCTETMAENVVAAKHPLLFYNCLNIPYKQDRVYTPVLGVKYRTYKLALGHLIKKMVVQRNRRWSTGIVVISQYDRFRQRL